MKFGFGWILLLIVLLGFGSITSRGASDSHNDSVADSEIVRLLPFPEWEFDPIHPEFLRGNLKKYGLVPLPDDSTSKDTLRIRFLWIRSFHVAVLFEVNFDAKGVGHMTSKFWKKHADTYQWSLDKNKQLTEADLKAFSVMIERWGLFDSPWYDDSASYDGSSWFIEIQKDGKCHAMYRDSPRVGPIWEFGRMLIEGSIESEYLPIY